MDYDETEKRAHGSQIVRANEILSANGDYLTCTYAMITGKQSNTFKLLS